ncbi:MAG TPA: DNA internalization-related competence protein ComEC/Rec2, partial [Limnobacter sp.]|nr:DNA internalization-related competence protein ComEC/Rec2 [Limnobacter sp.]
PDDREMYSNTGIAHLVAISGLHITLLALVAGKLAARAWRCSSRLCLAAPAPLVGAGVGLLLGIFYGLVAGWGIPAQRTVFMLAALFAGQLRGGLMSSWDSFFLALFLAVMLDNWSVLDAGFLLSFGAVGILIFAHQGHLDFIRRALPVIRKAVKAQYAVTIGLVLPTAILFNQHSVVSPLVNALSIPWMSFVSTPLALLGGLLQQDWAARLSADSLALQRQWLLEFDSFDWAVLPLHSQPYWVYAMAGLGCLVLLLPAGLTNRGIGLLLLGFLAWPPARPESGGFWMTVLDVGQGTAIAIQTSKHLLIYDAGPAFNTRSDSSRRVILPWLRQQGHDRPDVFMLSHDDADHSGGAPMLLSKAPPTLFAASIGAEHRLNQLARKQNTGTANCHTLPAWTWDGVLFQPMGLDISPEGNRTLLLKNNQSCVLKISNRHHSLLLTGDIEAASEMQLLAKHGAVALKARVLLAPHHGSKTSSTLAFLNAVGPEHVLIQAGWQNRFGHPHPQVTARYESLGAQWSSTAQHGALRWEFPGGPDSAKVSNALDHRRRYWHLHEKGAQP